MKPNDGCMMLGFASSAQPTNAVTQLFLLALAFAVAFDFVCPLSVASQQWFCQGEMHMGEQRAANAMHTDVYGRPSSCEAWNAQR